MIFLNHGSYGATPRVVLAEHTKWRDKLEQQPCQFINRHLPGHLDTAIAALARFVGSAVEAMAFVENATSGVGAILRSLDFQPGDRIVITDHIYNAVRQCLLHICERTGAELDIVTLGLPLSSPEEIVERMSAAITGREKLVVIDHVASASAVLMPVDRLVSHCRHLGVPVLVDGAHGPGMLTLDLDALDADYYVGNCHKWLCAPKSAAFMRVAERARDKLHPLAISHQYGRGFPYEFHMIGTRDWSAHLAVPSAIDFHNSLGGAALRERNHRIAIEAGSRIAAALGTSTGAPAAMTGSMVTIAIPRPADAEPATREEANRLKDWLWDDHRIETHVMPFAGKLWVRICIHAYNDLDQTDRLAEVLAQKTGH